MSDKLLLRLYPSNQPTIDISLVKKRGDILKVQPHNYIYADSIYRIEIIGMESNFVVKRFCINNKEEEFLFSNERITFPGKNNYDRTIFSDYFGFASISLTLENADGETDNYFSEYLSIKVRDNTNNQRIEKMLEYVFSHQSFLLSEKAEISVDVSGQKGEQQNNIEARIALAEEIARFYDNSIGHFSTNSQYKIREKYIVDHIEKIQKFSSQTLQYISTHPEYLKETTLRSGIRVNGRNLYPEKTLMSVNIKSFNTYENRVILSFLKRVIIDLQKIQADTSPKNTYR